MTANRAVALLEQEQRLFDSIEWQSEKWLRWEQESQLEMFEDAKDLSLSLLKRKAIPQIRVDYFVRPELNFGSGKSRKQVFEDNGTAGENIYRHPHFLAYLWYFINGPKLPQSTIDGFIKILRDDAGTSGMVLKQIGAFVRKEVRDHNLEGAHDEFAKLALEIDRADLAANVRQAAKTARR